LGFVIWKKRNSDKFYFYFIESPVWQKSQFEPTLPGVPHRDMKFPCTIRKFELSGDELVVCAQSDNFADTLGPRKKLPELISESWGAAHLTVFKILPDEEWGQISSEIVADTKLRSFSGLTISTGDSMFCDRSPVDSPDARDREYYFGDVVAPSSVEFYLNESAYSTDFYGSPDWNQNPLNPDYGIVLKEEPEDVMFS